MKKIYCKLMPEQIVPHLEKRIHELEEALSDKKKALENAPPGKLRISMQGKFPRLYHILSEKDTRGSYLKSSRKDFAKELAQKAYDKKIKGCIEKQLKAFKNLLFCLHKNDIQKIYDAQSQSRKSLTTSVIASEKEFAQKWLEQKFAAKGFSPDFPAYICQNGLRVRSKSEIIIAQTLTAMNIPFKYECPKVINEKTVHPDFTCLNLRTRTEIIWEHFGMMDDSHYASNAVMKFNSYIENGFTVGEKFIFSMESKTTPFTAEMARQIICHYLL